MPFGEDANLCRAVIGVLANDLQLLQLEIQHIVLCN